MSIRLRLGAAIVAGALALVGFTAVGAEACACGAMVPPKGSSVDVDAERALVKLDSGVETIALQLNMLGGSTEAALVVPTPAPARVSAGDTDMFTRLDELTEPEVRVVNDWWPSIGGDGATAVGSAPTVVRQVQLGPLEATTLKGGTTKSLKKWLSAHHYVLSPAVRDGLADYVRRGWSFVAVRLKSHRDLNGGTPPLLIKFPSKTLVYPMRLSRAATEPQHVRMYVVGQHKMTRADSDNSGSAAGSSSVEWAGRIASADLDNAGLKEFFGTNDYLTVFSSVYTDPRLQISSDYRFVRAGDDDPYQPVQTRHHSVQVGGIYAGPLIAVAVAVLVLAGIITLVVRVLRRRKTSTL
ncbi:hypothetical protein BJY26_003355 [Spelaeicoccus albus]|uniref:DUF2330 domain-containing protein n=2 Tax=Spelaeicoccus albus TaxID=1280376 RepID=A0A7Z0IJ18_9MICO|nr:hypothetical protein [Spelaeicoccus albus]